MKSVLKNLLLLAVASLVTASLSAQTIAQWTFETSFPSITGSSTTLGGLAPELGSGTGSGTHASAATWSSPSGNGSSHSFSVNTWAVGDYFEFQVSTLGNFGIGFSFDQASSNTGPKDYDLQYSTDGSLFSTFASYSVLANASPNPTWNPTTASALYSFSYDLSAVTALDNAPAVYLRLISTSTTSANGGTVGTGGTDRMDNVTVYVVPEPSSVVLLGLTGFAALGLLRKRA